MSSRHGNGHVAGVIVDRPERIRFGMGPRVGDSDPTANEEGRMED